MGKEATHQARQTRDRPATEARLLEAGLSLFSQHGYAATSLEAIADRAGVNKALIVRYFGSKSGLLTAIASNLVRNKSDEDLPYPPQSTLRDEMLEYFRHRFREDIVIVDSIRFLFGRLLVDPEFKHQVEGMIGSPDRNFSDRIRALVEAGAIDASTDPALLYRTVSTFSIAVNFTTHQLLGVPEDECDAMFQLVSSSLDARLGSRAQNDGGSPSRQQTSGG